MGKPDAPRVGPVQHGCRQCARLRHEGQASRESVAWRKTGVQADARDQRTDAVWPEDAQQVWARRIQHGLLQRRPIASGRLLQSGGEHDGSSGSLAAQRIHQFWQRRCGGTDHRQVRRLRQRRDVRPGRFAVNKRLAVIDRPDLAPEAAEFEIAQHHSAQTALPVRSANHGDRTRTEQGFEIANAHKNPCTKEGFCMTSQLSAREGFAVVLDQAARRWRPTE